MTVYKRISVALLTIILLVSITIPAFADVAKPTFSIGKYYALPGEQLSIPISFSNNEQFNGMVFTLTFDPKVLSPVYAEDVNECFKKNLAEVPVNLASVNYTVKSDTSATLSIALAITENVTIADGQVGTVMLKVKSDAPIGTSDIGISFGSKCLSCMDSDGIYHFIEANTVNGSITVCDMLINGNPKTDTSTVPAESFSLTVSSFEGANMILGGYDSSGKLISLTMQTASGSSCTFNVNKTNGKLAFIKIFTLDGYTPTAVARCLGKI